MQRSLIDGFLSHTEAPMSYTQPVSSLPHFILSTCQRCMGRQYLFKIVILCFRLLNAFLTGSVTS